MTEQAQHHEQPESDWVDMGARRRAQRQYGERCQVPYRLRTYQPEQDEALIYQTYLRTLWRSHVDHPALHGHASREIRHDLFHDGQRAVLGALLRHARLLIATSREDDWQVLGWMLFDDLPSGLVLHYVYIKRWFRKAGLATEMVMDQLGSRQRLVYTHYTGPWRGLERSLKRAGALQRVYNPYLGT